MNGLDRNGLTLLPMTYCLAINQLHWKESTLPMGFETIVFIHCVKYVKAYLMDYRCLTISLMFNSVVKCVTATLHLSQEALLRYKSGDQCAGMLSHFQHYMQSL